MQLFYRIHRKMNDKQFILQRTKPPYGKYVTCRVYVLFACTCSNDRAMQDEKRTLGKKKKYISFNLYFLRICQDAYVRVSF